MICPVSSAYTIGVVSFSWTRYVSCLLWTGYCSSYLFPNLLAHRILICFMSATPMLSILPPLHLRCVGWLWTGHCSRFIISGTVCQLDIDLCQQHSYIGVILQYNSGSLVATLNKSTFQYVYFSLGYCVFTSF